MGQGIVIPNPSNAIYGCFSGIPRSGISRRIAFSGECRALDASFREIGSAERWDGFRWGNEKAPPGAHEMWCGQWVFWAPVSDRGLMNRTLEVGAIGTGEERGKRRDSGSGASDIPQP
jgi:hypothetical protein